MRAPDKPCHRPARTRLRPPFPWPRQLPPILVRGLSRNNQRRPSLSNPAIQQRARGASPSRGETSELGGAATSVKRDALESCELQHCRSAVRASVEGRARRRVCEQRRRTPPSSFPCSPTRVFVHLPPLVLLSSFVAQKRRCVERRSTRASGQRASGRSGTSQDWLVANETGGAGCGEGAAKGGACEERRRVVQGCQRVRVSNARDG